MPHAIARPGQLIAGGGMWVCAHCKGVKYIQARGLCQRCRKKPEIRALYPKGWANPATAKYTPLHTLDLVSWWLPLPDEPTNYLPGTKRKLVVMRRRARQGKAIFYPRDRRAE